MGSDRRYICAEGTLRFLRLRIPRFREWRLGQRRLGCARVCSTGDPLASLPGAAFPSGADCRRIHILGQSFAKNAGLYNERVGALHIVAPTSETAARVKSQLSVLTRSEISNPPAYGARVVGRATARVFISH